MDLFRINPEIISIHVPKTAGSTFHGLLQQKYGWRLKHIQAHKDLHIWNNGLLYKSNKPFVKAVHGHVEAHPHWLEQFPGAKLITWVRDPVERVISAYYHWKKEIDHKDTRHHKFVDRNPSIVDFVQIPEFAATVNALQTYLGRMAPDAYYFIGRTEHFAKDLERLAGQMNWKTSYNEKRNVNPTKPEVAAAVKAKLAAELKEEYDLYEALLRSIKSRV